MKKFISETAKVILSVVGILAILVLLGFGVGVAEEALSKLNPTPALAAPTAYPPPETTETPPTPTPIPPLEGEKVQVCGTQNGIPGCTEYDNARIELQVLTVKCIHKCEGSMP